jgi:hypothetical protein
MAFVAEIDYNFAGASTIERLIMQTMSTDLGKAAKAAKQSVAYMTNAQRGALRITGAHFRRWMREAFEKNTLNWPKPKEVPWFGKLENVQVRGVTAANRPIKTTTAKGVARKRGYSQRAVKMPKQLPIGGRLATALRYSVKNDSLTVGIIDSAKKDKKDKMSAFQEAGSRAGNTSSQRYLAAIGIYTKPGHAFARPQRDLIATIQKKYPPTEDYSNVFEKILADKIKLGND